MASTETPQQSGQPHLQKQDLATLVCMDLSDKNTILIFVLGLASFSHFNGILK